MTGRRPFAVGRYNLYVAEMPGYIREQSQPRAVDTIVVRNEEAHLNLERVTLIHNPTAGDGRPSATDLTKILEESGFQVRYRSSKKDWKKTLQEKADIVAVAGGDGTLAKVLKELRGSGVPAALIPVGTANNISRSLGVSGDARELVDGWRGSEPRPFDIGIVSAGDDELHFAEGAGGGLFAQLMVEASEEVGRAGSIVGHEIDRGLIHLRRQLEDAPSRSWRVTVDEVDRSGDYIAVETMNIRHAGPSIPIAPDADPGDGLLDVVLITSGERDELMDYIDQRLAQHEIKLPGLIIYRGTRIELAVEGVPMRIDDKVVAQDGAQWSITIEPGAVQILGTREPGGN